MFCDDEHGVDKFVIPSWLNWTRTCPLLLFHVNDIGIWFQSNSYSKMKSMFLGRVAVKYILLKGESYPSTLLHGLKAKIPSMC